MAFIDEMRAEGYAVESVCRVLREQGLQIAARTYRLWNQPARVVSERTVTDAIVEATVAALAWTLDGHGCRRLTPEGLYGRRKMAPLVRRSLPDATPGAVDRAMRSLGLSGVRRSKGVRTTIPAKDGRRAGDLLDRDFTAPAPNRTWVMDFTYVRTWAGFEFPVGPRLPDTPPAGPQVQPQGILMSGTGGIYRAVNGAGMMSIDGIHNYTGTTTRGRAGVARGATDDRRFNRTPR